MRPVPSGLRGLPATVLVGAGFLLTFSLLGAGCGRQADTFSVPPDETKVGLYGAWSATPLERPDWQPPFNLILITLDTTRQDRLSCYGHGEPTSPRLDALAAEGVLFERAVTPVPVTLPAHATILTGFYPHQHGVRNNGTYVLHERFTTLAEILKARGYETGAVLGAFPVDHRFGLAQGFDHYDDAFPATSIVRRSDTAQRPALDVTQLGLAWIGEQAGNPNGGRAPFFLWLHYFDPHAPYAPPEPFRGQFADPYDGEIAAMDAAIGQLIDGLEASGLLERSVIMVVGDHGESLGDHEEMTHSIFIYNATQRVPFILRLPDVEPFAASAWRGRRIAAPVNLVDCFPTALNLLGVREEERPLSAGRSLAAVIEGAEPGHRWMYHETLVPRIEYSWSDLRGIETERWKYIRAPRPELYDLSRDPGERTNLADKHPKRVAAFEAALANVLRADLGGETGQVEMDQETVEKLRSLGYMAGAATTRPAGPARDPKDMIRSYERVNLARTLASERLPAEALAVVDTVLVENPDDVTALRIRASCLVRLGRGPDAIVAYDELLEHCGACPDRLELLEGRATASLVAGEHAEAIRRLEDLIQTTPSKPGLRPLLSMAYRAGGDLQAARRAIEEEARVFPNDPTALVSLANFEREAGNRARAEAVYRRALDINPHSADAMVGLAEVLILTQRVVAGSAYIDQAILTDASHPGALFRKAWFERRAGNAERAAFLYQQSLARDPDNTGAIFNLANLYMESGNLDAALDLYKRLAASGRTSQDLFLNMGVIHAQRGEMQEAIAHWEQAIEMDPGSPVAEGIRQNVLRAREQIGR